MKSPRLFIRYRRACPEDGSESSNSLFLQTQLLDQSPYFFVHLDDMLAQILGPPVNGGLVHLLAHPDEIRVFHGLLESRMESVYHLGGKALGAHDADEA